MAATASEMRTGLLVALSILTLSLPAGESGTWQKIATEDQMLRDPQQVMTPGLFDQRKVKTIAFSADGSLVELPLPHEGNGADGKPRPVLRGAQRQRSIWIDLDGNGKPDGKELSGLNAKGETGPFSYTASYADGTTGTYVFKLQATRTPGEYRIVRHCAKVARIEKKHTVVLIDDDGNGLYNDLGRDAILVDQQPVTFLGRQIYLDDKLFELLVHAGGAMIEIRPMAHYQTGAVDLFKGYTSPQKANNLRILTAIVQGEESSFGFSPRQAVRALPVGAYDLTFALFERSTERLYVLGGDKTSFSVEANKETTLKWGGPIEARVSVDSDGRHLTVSPPAFFGAAGEAYLPSDWQKIPCHGSLSVYKRDQRGKGVTDRLDLRSTQKFMLDPGGELKPLVFEHLRSDVILIGVSYKSGILGPVRAEHRLNFVSNRGR